MGENFLGVRANFSVIRFIWVVPDVGLHPIRGHRVTYSRSPNTG